MKTQTESSIPKRVIIKSNGDFRVPLRWDKKEGVVIEETKNGFYKVQVDGYKTLKLIDPKRDIYEEVAG